MRKRKNKIPIIIRKEIRQILRDKISLTALIFLPLFILLMFGYALTFDVKHAKLYVYDQNNSKESREFINSMIQSEYIDLKGYVNSYQEIDSIITSKNNVPIIVIPKDFNKFLANGDNVPVQVLISGVESNIAGIILGYINSFSLSYSINSMLSSNAAIGIEIYTPIECRSRIWFNPELKSLNYTLPGLLGFVMMIAAAISTAVSIAKEKERGSIEQIKVSPVLPYELIISKSIPYMLIALFNTSLIIFFCIIVFGIAIKGSIILLTLTIFVFLIGALGFGVLISTLVDTQEIAFLISVMASMLPSILLSGFIFPIENMPVVIQAITYIVQSKYLLEIIRGIMLKGVGLEVFWDSFIALVIFAVGLNYLSIIRMKKEL